MSALFMLFDLQYLLNPSLYFFILLTVFIVMHKHTKGKFLVCEILRGNESDSDNIEVLSKVLYEVLAATVQGTTGVRFPKTL